jgi:hypothetical protein
MNETREFKSEEGAFRPSKRPENGLQGWPATHYVPE